MDSLDSYNRSTDIDELLAELYKRKANGDQNAKILINQIYANTP